MTNVVTFGVALRTARQSAGFGLRQFASLTGYSPTYVSVIEGDKERPSRRFVESACMSLGDNKSALWHASGMLPTDLADLLMNHPEEWDHIAGQLRVKALGRKS